MYSVSEARENIITYYNMATRVKTSKELGKAIKNKEDVIIVEGDLKKRIIRIKATGKVAWAIAGASVAAAVTLYVITPAASVASAPAAGVGGAISFTGSVGAATAAYTILGIKATWVAIGTAVASGGIGGITTLRDKYTIVKKEDNSITLKIKK